MDFDWTSREKQLKARVAGIFDKIAIEEVDTLGDNALPELKSITTRFQRRLAEVGYFSLGIGPASGMEALQLAAVQEELARVSASLFVAVETTARLFGGLLAGFADAASVQDITDELSLGNLIAGVALSEAEANAPDDRSVTAKADAADFIINGQKTFCTNAPIADIIAVQGTVNGSQAFFLVEAGHPGLSIGPRLHTVGYDGLAVAGITLNLVRVPRNRVLGPFEAGASVRFLCRTQDMILTMASVGLTQRVLKSSKSYAQSHIRGGRPVFRFQEVRFKLAEMETLFQTAELLAFRAAWLYTSNDPEAATVLHSAKVFCAESAERVASLAMQIMAGPGYVRGNLVESGYRDAKFAQLAGTTSEVARMAIADDLLNRYRV